MFNTIISSVVGRVMAISLIVMTAAFGVQTLRVSLLKGKLESVEMQLSQCQGSLQLESDNRESERTTDVSNERRRATVCRAEREAAVIAGRSIESIVNGKNEDGTDRGSLVTSDELRDIVSENRH